MRKLLKLGGILFVNVNAHATSIVINKPCSGRVAIMPRHDERKCVRRGKDRGESTFFCLIPLNYFALVSGRRGGKQATHCYAMMSVDS